MRRSPTRSTSSRTWATAPTTTRACWRSAPPWRRMCRITFKILYNDATAATGGQPLPRPLNVPGLTRQLEAEGVAQDRGGHRPAGEIRPGRAVRQGRDGAPSRPPRRRAARAARGRRRDRARLRPDLRRREAPASQARQVSRSRPPLVHQHARVRRLRRLQHQVELRIGHAGGDGVRPQARDRPVVLQQGLLLPERLLPELRQRARAASCARPLAAPRADDLFANLPEPALPALAAPHSIVVAGVGGTGIITVGALLGMAAHLEGKGVSVLDMTGVAQKGGAVTTFVRIAARPEDLTTIRIAAGEANAVIGADLLVTAENSILTLVQQGVTRAVINTQPHGDRGVHQEPRPANAVGGDGGGPARRHRQRRRALPRRHACGDRPPGRFARPPTSSSWAMRGRWGSCPVSRAGALPRHRAQRHRRRREQARIPVGTSCVRRSGARAEASAEAPSPRSEAIARCRRGSTR